MDEQKNHSVTLHDFWNKEQKNNSTSFDEDVVNSLNINLIYTNQFDWRKYFETYPDIQGEHNELNAYKHWIELGKQENRCAGKKFSQEPFERFEYESYAKLNPDLIDFNEMELYYHWMTHGIYENRLVTPIETYNYSTNMQEKIDIREHVDFFKTSSNNEKWLTIIENNLKELNWKDYLHRYNDLVENGLQTQKQTILHWLLYGKEEGRIGYKPRIGKNSYNNLQELVKKKTEEDNELTKETKFQLENDTLKNVPMFIINLSERIDKKIEMKSQLKKVNFSKYNIYRGYDKYDKQVQSEYERYHRQYERGQNKTTFHNSKTKCKVITSIGAVGLIKSTIELFKEIESMNLNYIQL